MGIWVTDCVHLKGSEFELLSPVFIVLENIGLLDFDTVLQLDNKKSF